MTHFFDSKTIESEDNFRTCCRKHWEEDSKRKPIGRDGVLWEPFGMPFIVCKVCGNKRCPKATDCSLECTNSNAIGQKGSIFE
jgi:hypothetical protein